MWSMSKWMQEVDVFLVSESSFPGPNRCCPCKQTRNFLHELPTPLDWQFSGVPLSLDTGKESMP